MNYYNKITLQQIHVFIVTAECESITKAAEKLHLTHSAVSKSIQNMETALELQLFVRDKQRIHLTRAGRALCDNMKSSLEKMDRGILEAEQIQSVKMPSLKIGLPSGTDPSGFLFQTANHFRDKRSHCRIYYEDYFYQVLPEKLKKREIDIAISYFLDTKSYQQGFVSDVLITCPLMVCLHKSNPLAKKKRIGVEELRPCNFLVTNQIAGSSYGEMLQSLCARYKFVPKTDYLAHSNGLITYNIQEQNDVLITDAYVMNLNPDVVVRELKNERTGLIIAYNSDDQNSLISQFVAETIEYLNGQNFEAGR